LMMVVFFMLSSSLTNEGRLHIRLPEASGVPAGSPKRAPLVVTISRAGSYFVNGRELINTSPQTLSTAILEQVGTERHMQVTIRADARTTHQSVVTAMDVLGRLGFVELNIATVPDEPAGRP
ncbi:MAG: ExbD/TolR family protein, partial [Steroidobacteraceae bacterium]